ncbi:MAG: hypothetical protein CFH06_00453 [Alphaproteobacteria bacterium MarineAlpha3_Bin5]|nr:phytanoyl-CoA dioxygenase [Magnetovibrio sp.]PPR79236.1 MAG: hypothetical protein CFH06_00453 [Alphaproteobacteria bacterium MarineAlpha3_Bin5]|tara:strand:- start:206 stop:961 length:756 start_codon:yes stop_codon:yes gene_type:complete
MIVFPDISDAELATFSKSGFLLIPKAFDEDAISKISEWTHEVAEMPEISGRQWVYHEKSLVDGMDIVSRIENISPFHTGYRELTKVLQKPASQLLGEKAVLFKEKINFKMPGGDGFKPHQDSQAGWDKYADFFVSALISIDSATIENGCLKIVDGYHKKGLFRSWEPLNDQEMDGMKFTPVPTNPGDVIFFDCFAPHASDANRTKSVRRIYYATYNKLSAGNHLEKYYADKHKTYPPDIDREIGKEYIFRV